MAKKSEFSGGAHNGLPALASPSAAAMGGRWGAGSQAVRKRPLNAPWMAERQEPLALVVEPDESARSLLSVGLSRKGFSVVTHRDADAALASLRQGLPLPAVVVCETEMHGLDGFGFCTQLRAESRTADVPLVLLSRRAEGMHRELAAGSGADQFLPKPLFVRDVVALAQLFAGKRSVSGAFESDTETGPLWPLVRALLSGSRSGRIELLGQGYITFREGRVVDAGAERIRGMSALTRLLLCAEGTYTVAFGPSLVPASFSWGLEELCARTLPLVSRWEQAVARGVPLDARLQVDFRVLAQRLEEIPDAVNSLLRLFDGRRSVRECVLDGALDEVTSLSAATKLYALGVLVPLSAPPRAVKVSSQDPVRRGAPTDVLRTPQRLLALPMTATPTKNSTSEPERSSPVESELEWVDAQPQGTSQQAVWRGTLSPELARQMEAFNIQPVVESAEVERPPEATPASGAATALEAQSSTTPDGPLALALERAELERAFFETPTAPGVAAKGTPTHSVAGTAVSMLVGAALVFGALAVVVVMTPEPPPRRVVSAPPSRVSPSIALSLTDKPMHHLNVNRGTANRARLEMEPEFVQGLPETEPSSSAVAAFEADLKKELLGNPVEVLRELEDEVEREPQSSEVWLKLAVGRLQARYRAGAEAAALQALRLDPTHPRATLLLSHIYLGQGDRAKARELLERFLSAKPQGAFADAARKLLAAPPP